MERKINRAIAEKLCLPFLYELTIFMRGTRLHSFITEPSCRRDRNQANLYLYPVASQMNVGWLQCHYVSCVKFGLAITIELIIKRNDKRYGW